MLSSTTFYHRFNYQPCLIFSLQKSYWNYTKLWKPLGATKKKDQVWLQRKKNSSKEKYALKCVISREKCLISRRKVRCFAPKKCVISRPKCILFRPKSALFHAKKCIILRQKSALFHNIKVRYFAPQSVLFCNIKCNIFHLNCFSQSAVDNVMTSLHNMRQYMYALLVM